MKLDPDQKNKLIADSRYQDIGNLPSNFFPYPSFKNLLIRPLSVGELRFISKAASLDDHSHMLRAVDLCISEPAAELSIGDYYYVLAWLRLHSMPKAPSIVNWTCTSKVYKSKETGFIRTHEEPEPENPQDFDIVECGCENSELIHVSQLEVIQLPEEEGFGVLPEGFDFPRASLIQETRELIKDPELRFLIGPAQWVAGATMQDKLNTLLAQPGLDMFDTASALSDMYTHGIKETTTLHCRQCRATYPYELKLEPHDFFQ